MHATLHRRPSAPGGDEFSRRDEVSRQRLARQVAQAAGTFEHLLTGRVPASVTVVSDGDWLVVSLLETFTPLERRLAGDAAGAARVHDFHRYLFDESLDSLRSHLRRSTGVELQSGVAHIDTANGSVLKTYTTNPAVELFLLGQGVPALGVPVNTHLHANGASGNGAACV
jgi:uncharacterized protein YbcI